MSDDVSRDQQPEFPLGASDTQTPTPCLPAAAGPQGRQPVTGPCLEPSCLRGGKKLLLSTVRTGVASIGSTGTLIPAHCKADGSLPVCPAPHPSRAAPELLSYTDSTQTVPCMGPTSRAVGCSELLAQKYLVIVMAVSPPCGCVSVEPVRNG